MASVVRQPKKVYCEMIGMGAKSITIARAVTADFCFDCMNFNYNEIKQHSGPMVN
jgi:hypothetical protein